MKRRGFLGWLGGVAASAIWMPDVERVISIPKLVGAAKAERAFAVLKIFDAGNVLLGTFQLDRAALMWPDIQPLDDDARIHKRELLLREEVLTASGRFDATGTMDHVVFESDEPNPLLDAIRETPLVLNTKHVCATDELSAKWVLDGIGDGCVRKPVR